LEEKRLSALDVLNFERLQEDVLNRRPAIIHRSVPPEALVGLP
jgi:hypothetical protein